MKSSETLVMTEAQAPTYRHELTFASGSLNNGSAGPPAAVAVVAAIILFNRRSVIFEPPGDSIGSIALIAFLACLPFVTIGEQWTIRVAPVTRRLTIFKRFTLRWTATVLRTTIVEDCSFEECSEVGVSVTSDDNGNHYGVYLDFKRGGRHVIPVQYGLLSEATRNATELATVTGIPRRDDIS